MRKLLLTLIASAAFAPGLMAQDKTPPKEKAAAANAAQEGAPAAKADKAAAREERKALRAKLQEFRKAQRAKRKAFMTSLKEEKAKLMEAIKEKTAAFNKQMNEEREAFLSQDPGLRKLAEEGRGSKGKKDPKPAPEPVEMKK